MSGRHLRGPEAAEYLGVSTRTLEDWRIRGGGPPFIRISCKCVRYRLIDLDEWSRQRLATSTSAETKKGQ
ncbi:MAG TPA: helix-turn-helix domain-containing protein [Planctomycetota bacterium]|nr:helix-turn-helix domain-containing protein [Planctomycetota bacterium]